MLKPAILYKEILERKFAEQLYSDDYFYYNGYVTGATLPIEIKSQEIYINMLLLIKMIK